MSRHNSWFEVSQKGLRELQEGKPKHYILRELVQNAWDEATKQCIVQANLSDGICTLSVEDDSPTGFRNLADAFTLFAPTYKRANPEKRGRFNLGEKQVLAVCISAWIETTKGTLIFNKRGRTKTKEKRKQGSKVTVLFKCAKSDYDEMLEIVRHYLVPPGIEFIFNGQTISNRPVYKTTEAILPTEIEIEGVMRPTKRKTKINIHESEAKTFLYELGIPVCEIDCKFSVDIQQKVPLSPDRESVPPSYLSHVFAEVLNATHDKIASEESSEVWIREAVSNDRVSDEAVKNVIQKRYGDKVVVANPSDRSSIDEAISKRYRVVYGSELSKKEWEHIRSAEAIPSSSELFGHQWTVGEAIEPDENMQAVANLAKRIAERCLGVSITVKFAKWQSMVTAQYGDRTLTFNVGNLGAEFFKPRLSAEILDLLIHELAHEEGTHTESGYHEAITKIAGELVIIALKEPDFFKIEGSIPTTSTK